MRTPVADAGRASVLAFSVALAGCIAQEKYSDGNTTLYLDGENALVTSDSFVVAGPCVSTVPLPVMQRY
jgi:hypothetical protein